MMIVRPISTPLAGEHIVTVEPRLAFPRVEAGWLKRLRLFQGRALDDLALTAEQESRAGKLALLGQTRSPGIVTGLEVSLETFGGVQLVTISPGIGLLPSGEDVVLGRELHVALTAFGAIDPQLRAALLVIAPVTTRAFDRFDPEDPCERDETEDAFSDEQRVDAIELQLVPWDAAWAPLDAAGARRNQLAYTIFEIERRLPFGELAPWQTGGLPVAVLGLDGGAITYLDRHAVARVGGDPPPRSPLVVESDRMPGVPSLWQARILQLRDHLAELSNPSLPSAISAGLERLPPAGILPKGAIDFTPPYTNLFFPPAWRLRAVPLPLEQLDSVLARAAALAPLETAISEEVMVLVPVPQTAFEPHLLESEILSPEFDQTIATLVIERTDWLGRRIYLRTRRDALLGGINPASVVPDPDPDPDRLEDEGGIGAVSAAEEAFDVQLDGDLLRPAALVALNTRLFANPALSDADRKSLYALGLEKFIESLDHRVKQGDDAIDFGFLRAQSDIYRLRQLMLGNALGTKLATSPALATIAKGETAGAVRNDLATLFTTLKQTPPPPSFPTTTTEPSVTNPPPSTIGRTAVFSRPVRLIRSPSSERIAAAVRGVRETAAPELVLGPAGVSTPSEVFSPTTFTALRALDFVARDELAVSSGIVADDIREGGAIVGAGDFRNVTMAQRLEAPGSTEAKSFAVATRHDGLLAVQKLSKLDLNVDDIPVYAVPNGTARDTRTFAEVKGNLDQFINDPNPADPHEGAFFHDTVMVLEAHIGTLRGLEGRIAQYRAVVRDCQAVLAAIRTSLARLDTRMTVVQHEITEVRHAIATTRTLREEDDRRVKRINARRTAVIAEHVQLLAYVRPRFFDCITEVPELALDPALLESPVPACIGGHGDAPPALDEMVALLREAPLSWFKLGPKLLDHLDRTDLLHGAILTARTRATAIANSGFTTTFAANTITGRFAKSLSAVGLAQVEAVVQPRIKVAELDARRLIGLSWLESRDVAQHIVSLGDLIEGTHRRAEATRRAHALIANIEKVAGCLWAQVGEVLPAIRLAWADALDQYDRGRVTINLSALPRWIDVPYQQRKSIELLADWLIDHIDRTVPAAVSWMHDLVRACILLASHAPIDQIISGSVPTPSPAGPGHLVPVAIDPTRIKVGMRVTFFRGHDTVAHGIVEDLIGDRARARIAEASIPELRLDAGTRARFAVAGSPAAPLTREHRG